MAASGEAELTEQVLRTVVPDLERVHLLGETTSVGRTISLKLGSASRPVPLRSMGDGATRVFGIALPLAQAQNGAVLIDEVENGLHYSVQGEVWTSIFALAQRLNVQVFATTHSWDCVVGFQYAANRSAAEGFLYRLERKQGGNVDAVLFSESEVAIAAEQQIEIR